LLYTPEVIHNSRSAFSVENRQSSRASHEAGHTQPVPLFGITCTQVVGLGSLLDNTTYQYSVRLSDPGTNSGSGHVTNRVWQGTVAGPADFDVKLRIVRFASSLSDQGTLKT